MTVGEPALEDLTAKARLRDAAMRLFAEQGIEATSVREIAKAAGVTGGLIRHHFGSKDELRAACDAYALTQLTRVKEQALARLEKQAAAGGQPAEPWILSVVQPGTLPLLRYLARSALDGSPSAAAVFSEMVAMTEDWLDANHPGEITDRRGYAAVFVAMELGALMLRDQLSGALGADVLEPDGQPRLARAKIEFYSTPLLRPEVAAAALAAIDRLHPER